MAYWQPFLERRLKKMEAPAIRPSAQSNGVKIILSMEAAEKAYGSESLLMQTARGSAWQGGSGRNLDNRHPVRKKVFKSGVLDFLSENMKNDPGFMAALKSGQVTVQTVDEVPELNIQPYVNFTMYKNGNHQGTGSFGPSALSLTLPTCFREFRRVCPAHGVLA